MFDSKQSDRANAAAALYEETRDFDLVLKSSGIRRDNLVGLLVRRGLMEPKVKEPRADLIHARGPSPLFPVVVERISQSREPCWRCGTRADLGCGHQRPDQ